MLLERLRLRELISAGSTHEIFYFNLRLIELSGEVIEFLLVLDEFGFGKVVSRAVILLQRRITEVKVLVLYLVFTQTIKTLILEVAKVAQVQVLHN